MYLKILSRESSKSDVLANVRHVEFFRSSMSGEALKEQLNYADLPLVANEINQTAYEESQDMFCVGSLNIVFDDGSSKYIVFDGVAFLCNETGKAVERFLAN